MENTPEIMLLLAIVIICSELKFAFHDLETHM